jgi:Skp family chaperone for outer membrane proteins
LKRIAFVVLSVALVGAALAAPAVAQQAKKGNPPATTALKIAVIDVETIRREAAAIKTAREQLNRYQAAFQADIQKEEAELRNANQELARQRTILSPEAFAEERKKFEQRLVEVQRLMQQRKQQLDDSWAEVMRKINDSMNEVITELAVENGYSMIVRFDSLIFAGESLVITKAALDRLNKKLPTIQVQDPTKKALPPKTPPKK